LSIIAIYQSGTEFSYDILNLMLSYVNVHADEFQCAYDDVHVLNHHGNENDTFYV